jgi:ABC-type multidrug transport system permease subunit
VIEPGYMDKVLEISYYETLEKYPEALANMDLNQYIETAKPYTWFTYPAILFMTILFGFIYSLILGFFIKTNNA